MVTGRGALLPHDDIVNAGTSKSGIPLATRGVCGGWGEA